MLKPLTLSALSLLFATPLLAQTPADIPGLQLWLDATDASTIATSGGQVTQWDDKSGNDFHATQTDPLRQPTVGAGVMLGQNAIRFDGVAAGDPNNDGLAINTGLNVQRPYSVVMIDQTWSGLGGRTLTSASGVNWLTGRWAGNPRHYVGGWVGPAGGAATGVPNPPAVTAAVGTSTTNLFSIDGGNPGINNANFASPGNLGLGAASSWDEPSDADVGEIIVVNRALTDSDNNIIAEHISNNWNVPTYRTNHATRTQTFTGSSPGQGLDFSGTFHAAVNAGTAPAGQVIGDATFTSDAGTISSENEIPAWGGSPTGFADTNLNQVMQSIRWTSTTDGGQDDVTVSVTGLTVGNTYKAQLLFGDTANDRHFSATINGDPAAADFQQAAHTGTSTSVGVALIHEFVAESTTLDIVLDNSAGLGGTDQNPLLQGFTVEDEGVTVMTTTGTFASASDLDFSGAFTHAVSFAGPAATVGDASFVTDGGAGVLTHFENTAGNWVAPDYGATPDDNALEMVMKDIRWTGTNSEHEQLGVQLENLLAGQEYKLQLLWDEATNVDRTFDVMIDGVLVVDDFSTGASFGNPLGSVLTHTFTSTDDILNITLDGFSAPGAGDRNPTFHALTLEAIPEPSAAALMGIALLGLLSRRRR